MISKKLDIITMLNKGKRKHLPIQEASMDRLFIRVKEDDDTNTFLKTRKEKFYKYYNEFITLDELIVFI